MNLNYFIVYPNLYTILVSDSGVGNKTTAIKIGTEGFLAKVPNIMIMRGALTSAYLADWMVQATAKNSRKAAEVTVFCEEFKVFAKGLYADSGLIENLTKLYDCGTWDYRTKGGGAIVVDNPCVNILAASTPEWLTTGSAADFIGGGFSSRIIPAAILKDEKEIAIPKMPPAIKALEPLLLADLISMERLQGEFIFTKDGEDFFINWYGVRRKHENPDQRMRGFYAKKHTLVLKVAMILSISLDDNLIVTEDHIQAALQLIGKLELNIPFAFQGVAWGEQAKYQDKVLMKIKASGEIGHSELMQHFHYAMSGSDLKQIIQTLLDEDVISFEKKATGGKMKIIYKWKGNGGGN